MGGSPFDKLRVSGDAGQLGEGRAGLFYCAYELLAERQHFALVHPSARQVVACIDAESSSVTPRSEASLAPSDDRHLKARTPDPTQSSHPSPCAERAWVTHLRR